MTYEKDPARLTNSLHNLKVLYDAGIPIAMGTDNMLEMMGGEVEHKELAYYVEAGLTPMEAITLATGNAARHLGIEDRKGFVKEGMEADLILLDQDPSQDISNIQFIHQVFCKGKIVYSQEIRERFLSAWQISSDQRIPSRVILCTIFPEVLYPETSKIFSSFPSVLVSLIWFKDAG